MLDRTRCWLGARSLETEYRRRRERYAAEAAERGRADAPGDSLLRYLEAAGRSRRKTEIDRVRTVSFIPLRGWHGHLLNELRLLGPLANFDYEAAGISRDALHGSGRAARSGRAEVNRRFRAFVERSAAESGIDWIFAYAEAFELAPDTVRWCQDSMGISVVVMSLDAKHSWSGPEIESGASYARDLAGVADLFWTSARVTCDWVAAEGGRPLYLPEGCDATFFHPIEGAEQDIPVSFVGAKYGPRAAVIRRLKDAGVAVRVHGRGWNRGSVSDRDMRELFLRSRINLGIGAVGHSTRLTNVKARDFDVPCTGGGLYLTTYNWELARELVVGDEIACYANDLDAVEQIRYYLAHPEEARRMATRARHRCVRQHRWVHRFLRVLQVLGIVEGASTPEALAMELLNPQES